MNSSAVTKSPAASTTARLQRPNSTRPARCKQHRAFSVVSEAQQKHRPAPGWLAEQSRRTLLFTSLAAVLAARPSPAQAGFGWDGSSSAVGSCELYEAGDECRRKILLKDAQKSSQYGADVEARAGQLGGTASNVPVAQLDSEYVNNTLALAGSVEKYASLDLYDPERIKVIALLKKDGSTWASKYARGGSARKESARKFYIVVDALQGHFASNGFAPYPRAKLSKTLQDVDDVKKLLAQAR